ncbi:hypothetical protein KUTeg_010473 [Tegillarca granosa]|uniref:THO complex subunit 5 homolog n=1 Tax=Tegillarca granosa TaxID=220873 RepID=A0ABQ9F6T9_TEGGR|nr:hypothetical protein KUTeg_010473 [Tegillarca granosa]
MASKDPESKQDVKRKRTIKKETTSGAGGDSKKIRTEAKESSGKSLFYAEDEEAEEIEAKRVDATLQFVILKKLNRLAHIRCKKVREGTNEAKQRIDQYHLQLQNLSKDEEIELVSVQEFYEHAPAHIAKPEVTKKDSHQLTLSRLDWELEQRIQLDQQLVESKANKEQLEKEIKTKEEYLENLQPKLGAILQSTKPVQEYLDMPFDQIREQHQTACHLPEPLYVLYMQTSAYKDACDGSSLQLTFNYLLVLNIITVNIQLKTSNDSVTSSISGGDLLSADLLLNEIYDGDHGKKSPNSANQYELSRLGLRDFSSYIEETGRPFLWAQWLSGLQFLGDECPQKAQNSISSAHMQQTIKKLRKRIRSRLSLLKQLSSLERGSIPVSSEYQSIFPTKIISKLSSWRRSTYEDFAVLPQTKSLIDQEMASESDIYFTAVIERGSAKLTAQIVLKPNYPEDVPLFVISIQWKTERTAMNDFHVQKKSEDQILTNQLQRLLMCFDVYLESEVHCTESEGPVEISKEKVFARAARGPNRTKPYKYSPEMGIFTHR